MANPGGFIKLHRSFLKWEWYTDLNTKIVFIHLLLTANFEDKFSHGILVRRGETITSYVSLSTSLRLSERQARTAITHLKATGEVTVKRYSKFSLITIVNYDKYQDYLKISNKNDVLENEGDKQNDRQLSEKRQATSQANDRQRVREMTTPKEKKKEETNKSRNIIDRERVRAREGEQQKDSVKEFVPPTLEEIASYCEERHSPVNPRAFFDYYSASNWIDSRGSPVMNWKQRVIAWESDAENGNRKPKKGKASGKKPHVFVPTKFDEDEKPSKFDGFKYD